MSLQYTGTEEVFYLLQELYSEFSPATSSGETGQEFYFAGDSGEAKIFVTLSMIQQSFHKVKNLLNTVDLLCQ